MSFILQGFVLGISYVAPIGMQNLYVINTGLRKRPKDAFLVSMIVIFFDIALALLCFYGIGGVLQKYQLLKQGILLFGGVAVAAIGFNLIRSKIEEDQEVKLDESVPKIIASAFLVTWANPQAIIDGTLLFGGFRASLPTQAINSFIIGVALASFIWFMGLAIATTLFKKNFTTRILKGINVVCGGILMAYGMKLILSFIAMVR
ncbi:LysE/ArgO family amino acid transporter [Gottschalkiaceae bacterium SANA]|nr:LysE/ArgO family amino acid transporter [Gottschalkiaceae bacterium SANA]